MADSPLNVYLRTLKAILADAERELPPRSWRALTAVIAIASTYGRAVGSPDFCVEFADSRLKECAAVTLRDQSNRL
jgi:hypothetical protein